MKDSIGTAPAEQPAREELTLGAAMNYAVEWLLKLRTDGPDLLANAHQKAAHEAAELAADPCLEEFADVLICLAGAAFEYGFTEHDLAQSVVAKTIVNSAREWRQEPDGTWQHTTAVSGV